MSSKYLNLTTYTTFFESDPYEPIITVTVVFSQFQALFYHKREFLLQILSKQTQAILPQPFKPTSADDVTEGSSSKRHKPLALGFPFKAIDKAFGE